MICRLFLPNMFIKKKKKKTQNNLLRNNYIADVETIECFRLEMIVMAIVLLTGSLLLLVNNYASSPDKTLITDTALGVLLLLIAALLAYSGTLCLALFQTTINGRNVLYREM